MAKTRPTATHPSARGRTPAPKPTTATTESHDESQSERLRRRAAFLRDLAEAKELRARVSPRRTRVARLRDALRRATYHQA